ncbi:unnamed protein product [Amoebophrya sp. A25]|nr:unnamed protein product [Amoebophrya sp. A25]|eukprot:GSA25T00014595001.1
MGNKSSVSDERGFAGRGITRSQRHSNENLLSTSQRQEDDWNARHIQLREPSSSSSTSARDTTREVQGGSTSSGCGSSSIVKKRGDEDQELVDFDTRMRRLSGSLPEGVVHAKSQAVEAVLPSKEAQDAADEAAYKELYRQYSAKLETQKRQQEAASFQRGLSRVQSPHRGEAPSSPHYESMWSQPSSPGLMPRGALANSTAEKDSHGKALQRMSAAELAALRRSCVFLDSVRASSADLTTNTEAETSRSCGPNTSKSNRKGNYDTNVEMKRKNGLEREDSQPPDTSFASDDGGGGDDQEDPDDEDIESAYARVRDEIDSYMREVVGSASPSFPRMQSAPTMGRNGSGPYNRVRDTQRVKERVALQMASHVQGKSVKEVRKLQKSVWRLRNGFECAN